ncbi:MAG: hypothetical protein A3B38_01510 [Candidatus Levybacteria bacterium RIFCSPLOWO2_01_FULL_36_13]|nr:MAG: hypothetical protein A2684_02745 [Candidatus Levybacteria bacterium RIFCSPHIGHO2_01_FULL_36_15b]OGH35546.1 MAG: hypothetical protein A3B38_01510 [Candidatus Levybacteria bacterium RIFCSPLOWO2_01_FULL_36_13]
MKKLIVYLVIFALLAVILPKSLLAIYDPQSVPNNKFGIHILFPEEIGEAAALVNSSGGDWGYVTIPIRASDKNLKKWQTFMDECKKHHLIPVIRIATEGDYFINGSWEIPSKYYVIDFANFLNSLNWPTKNRYIVIFNEQNRGDEWGGVPDPVAYADILNYAVDIFKSRNSNFFIIFGGLDNAAPNVYGQYINQLDYIRQVEYAIPGVLSKIDGIAVHSYPNPGFSSPPTYQGQNSIHAHNYVKNLLYQITGKNVPIFITETGWSNASIRYQTQAGYYKTAFENAWSDSSVIAVTPFLLLANTEPFGQFSFIKNGTKTELYKAYQNFDKTKGAPMLEPLIKQQNNNIEITNIIDFSEKIKKSIDILDNNAKYFFKWLLNI